MHEAVRTFYPSSNILAVFQPHLFSRTRDFCADFASSLSMFDQVMLLEIYPARELPIEGISARSIAEKMPVRPNVIDKQNLATQISAMGADVVVLMGAGDIADEVETVVTHLKNEEYVG
jgi:UDP-N-acetylmuramate--alanine ligase